MYTPVNEYSPYIFYLFQDLFLEIYFFLIKVGKIIGRKFLVFYFIRFELISTLLVYYKWIENILYKQLPYKPWRSPKIILSVISIKSIGARFLRLSILGCRYDNSMGIFHGLSVPERGRKKQNHEWASACAKGMTHSLSILTALLRFYRAACVFIYIQRLHLLHARCSQAKHVRDSEELIHHILGSPNLAERPSSPWTELSCQKLSWKCARGKKVGWQRASFQIQRDFVTWCGEGRWNEEEREVEKKGPGERTFVPFVALSFSLFPARHARAPIVPRFADRFDCDHLSSNSVCGETLLDTTMRRIHSVCLTDYELSRSECRSTD